MELFILFWALGCVAFFRADRFYEQKRIKGVSERRFRLRYAMLIFLPLVLWAGFRGGASYADTNAYIALYHTIPNTFETLRDYVALAEKDKAFYWYTGLMSRIFGPENYHPYLLVITLVQAAALIRLYRRYSIDFALSFFFFIASGDYFAWMFNGIRQFLAVSIIYLAIPWLIEKKYIRFFAVVLLASSFHGTAILMIPIAIMTAGKPWNWRTLLFMALGVIAVTATNRFTGLMEIVLDGTAYEANLEEMKNQAGTNMLRVAFFCVPVVAAIIGRRSLERLNDPVLNLSINMSVVTGSLYVVSMVTSGVMMGRLPIYASLFNYVLLPYEIRYIVKDQVKIRRAVVAVYVLFYYYLMHIAYGRF